VRSYIGEGTALIQRSQASTTCHLVKVAAATPPNQPRRCILSDYFNNYNFKKAQIIRSLMVTIEPKHVGAVLMQILVFF
jgi:hypothetical protein